MHQGLWHWKIMAPDQRVAHLVVGPTAAGKSTYARALAADTNGVRFAIDEWMHALFSADMPERMDMAWAMTRVARCQAQVWSVAQQVLATGTDVVLEIGLLRRTDRDTFAAQIDTAGYAARFHFIDAELSVRRQRVLRRNAEKGETYSFDVTPQMFEAMEAYFERPSEEELARTNTVPGQQG
jgi:predicted kinase